MSSLTIFKNQNFGEVRTIEKNEDVWFVLNDVCTILEIANARDTKARLDKDDVGTTDVIDSLGRSQKMTVINEYALYECVLLSRKPNAKQFKRWITHEVIPQIRKTGSYSLMPKSYAEALRLYADEVEQRELMQKQRDEGAWPHWPGREQKKAQAKRLQSRAETWVRKKGSFASFSSSKKREAMNTASQKSKEVEKLKVELDRSKKFSSIKAAEIRLKSKFDWKPLRNYCTSHELEMPKIFDANYGSVRTYPAEAWQKIYGVDLNELF